MPDLAAFGSSGFPFSRLADLSESAVVLPPKPEQGDLSAYLSLMGLMGNVTGYPAHAVTVALATAKSTRWRTRTFWSSPAAPIRRCSNNGPATCPSA